MRILGYIVLCLVLPVAWGALVHLLFGILRKRSTPNRQHDDGSDWVDYQI